MFWQMNAYLYYPASVLGNLVREVIPIALATFGGAWAAFLFQRRHEQARTDRAEIANGRRAQLAIVTQYTFLRAVDSQALAKWRGTDEAWCNMPPAIAFTPPPQMVDTGSIEFLLDGSDPDILNHIAEAQSKVEAMQQLLRTRADWFIRVQDATADLVRAGGARRTDKEFEQHVGAHSLEKVRFLTDTLFECYDKAIRLNEKCFTRLRAALRERFPKAKLIAMQSLETERLAPGQHGDQA